MGFSRIGGRVTLTPEMKIHEAMQELKRRKVAVDENCPRCNFDQWNADLLEIPATSLMTSAQSGAFSGLGGGHYINTGASKLSVLTIVCRRCGYTMLHSLDVLGIPMR